MLKELLNYWANRVQYSSHPSAQHFLGLSVKSKTSNVCLATACGNGSYGCSGECECSGPCDGGCGTGEGD